MMMETARHFLIVGGNSGIGFSLVEALSRDGHQLTVLGRREGPWSSPDLIDFRHYQPASNQEIELPEKLDGLVYFPGSIQLKPFRSLKNEDFLKEFELNVLGAVEVIRKALPALKKSGKASVVLFSTVAVQQGMPFHAGIATAKGAVEGLTRSLAAELAPEIRVNAIAPSLTDTPLATNLLSSPEKREASSGRHPLKRIGNSDEMAALVRFLLSDDAGFITGQIIGADGGMSAVKLF